MYGLDGVCPGVGVFVFKQVYEAECVFLVFQLIDVGFEEFKADHSNWLSTFWIINIIPANEQSV
jgi:hypothetical protein